MQFPDWLVFGAFALICGPLVTTLVPAFVLTCLLNSRRMFGWGLCLTVAMYIGYAPTGFLISAMDNNLGTEIGANLPAVIIPYLLFGTAVIIGVGIDERKRNSSTKKSSDAAL